MRLVQYRVREVRYSEAKYDLPPQKVYFLSDTSSRDLRRRVMKFRSQIERLLSSASFFPMELEIVQMASQADVLLAQHPELSSENKAYLHARMRTLKRERRLPQCDMLTFCCHLLTPACPNYLMSAIDMEHVPEEAFLRVFEEWISQQQEHYISGKCNQTERDIPLMSAILPIGQTHPANAHGEKQAWKGMSMENTFNDSIVLLMPEKYQGIGSVGEEERWRAFLQEQSPEDIAANRELVFSFIKQIEHHQQTRGGCVFLEDTARSLLKELDRRACGESLSLLVRSDATFYLPEQDCTIQPHSHQAVALYVLYILHTEGIVRKLLPDYTEELLKIYRYFSPHKSLEESSRIVENLVRINDNNHSSDHYMTKLRHAFEQHLSPEQTAQYMLQGRRGEARRLSEDIHFDVPLELKRLIF